MSMMRALSHAAAGLALSAFAAAAAEYPAAKEGTYVAKDFKFHTGEVLPRCELHYRTIGEPSGEPVVVLHGTGGSGAAMLTPGLCGRIVRGRAAARREKTLHHPAGRHRAREIDETVRRAEGEVPEIQFRGHGRRAIPAAHGGARPEARAPRHRQLHGRHACVGVGRPLPGFRGRARAHGLAADRDGEPQLDAAPAEDRDDPPGPGLQQRRLHGAAEGHEARRRVLHRRHQRRHPRPAEGGADAGGGRQARRRAPQGAVHRRRQRLHLGLGLLGRLRPDGGAGADHRRGCSPSTPPTTSATRPRPASPRRP